MARDARRRERQELAGWQRGAMGLLLLAVLVNLALGALLLRERSAAEDWKAEYQQAETAYVSAQADLEVKKLALLAAMETYDWTIKGVRA